NNTHHTRTLSPLCLYTHTHTHTQTNTRTHTHTHCYHSCVDRCVRGLHLNMFNVTSGGVGVLLSLLLGPYVPSLVGLTREDVRRLFPYVEKTLHTLLRETGYLHIQATRPDTAGEMVSGIGSVSLCVC